MVKIIQLTKGFETLVDDEDFEFLSQWKWSACGHKRIYAFRGPNCYMHRVVAERMDFLVDGVSVDHKDGNSLNNQRSNLRIATHAQNLRNRKKTKNNQSGFKGVCRCSRKWTARIMVNYKGIYLGLFNTPEEAAAAYNRAALHYFGEFAVLNEIPSSD